MPRAAAAPWARLGSAAIDETVLAVPLVAVLLLGLRSTRSPDGGWHLASTLALVGWVVAALLYAVVGVGEGQTPGQRVLGIVVVDARRGTPIGYERALLRTVVLLLAVAPCGLGLLPLLARAPGSRRGWHDRAAGSVVVRGSLA
ncbi:hypothetical protein GCM10022197_11320 [Microlunatus spumicola]|uniref:RDD domain-containing protein n=1 Tax=Microlunatus spumicola TaxID=81499 RepID=A0ABP6WYZ4_9ACTN